MNKTIGYHFVNKTLRDGSPVPEIGVWLEYKGVIELCATGYHGSLHPFDALQYAPGNTLCLVEFDGEIIYGDDKLVAQKRKIIARFDAEELLFKFARDCALSVIDLWDAPDVVRGFLETGDESLRAAAEAAAGAARDAARDAAWYAASDAASDAAWYAAMVAAEAAAVDAMDADCAVDWAAAREKQRDLFKQVVDEEFDKLMNN